MRHKVLSLDFMREPAAPEQDPEEGHERRERISRALKTAIAQELTDRQRSCVTLYYFEKKSQPEISRELGIGVPSVSKNLKRARKNLERVLRYAI